MPAQGTSGDVGGLPEVTAPNNYISHETLRRRTSYKGISGCESEHPQKELHFP